MLSMSSMVSERRRHQRKGGDADEQDYFTVAGLPAQLVDWSFGGLGVAIRSQRGFSIAEAVELRIYDCDQETWETLTGQIRRIDANGTLGIAFPDDGENTVRVLLHLLSNRLARTLS